MYAYKLENFDKDWNYIGNRRFVTFTNLRPGKYLFKVKASNNDGVWNENPTVLKITITPPFWQTLWFRTFVILFVIGSVFGWYKMRIRSIEAQKEKLEIQVAARTKEIQTQKEVIEEKNNQILSSIRYAKRIQKAILPLNERLCMALPEHFIIYKPKDIVSGDFYWFNQVKNKNFIAVVDCTGHGVSGAFMSMIGNTLLNEIVNEKRIYDCVDLMPFIVTNVNM